MTKIVIFRKFIKIFVNASIDFYVVTITISGKFTRIFLSWSHLFCKRVDMSNFKIFVLNFLLTTISKKSCYSINKTYINITVFITSTMFIALFLFLHSVKSSKAFHFFFVVSYRKRIMEQKELNSFKYSIPLIILVGSFEAFKIAALATWNDRNYVEDSNWYHVTRLQPLKCLKNNH